MRQLTLRTKSSHTMPCFNSLTSFKYASEAQRPQPCLNRKTRNPSSSIPRRKNNSTRYGNPTQSKMPEKAFPNFAVFSNMETAWVCINSLPAATSRKTKNPIHPTLRRNSRKQRTKCLPSEATHTRRMSIEDCKVGTTNTPAT